MTLAPHMCRTLHLTDIVKSAMIQVLEGHFMKIELTRVKGVLYH
jgi:hypothetical protein